MLERIIEERDNILLAALGDEQVDFSELRKRCRMFNDECEGRIVFECDGTDQQLWESVTTYLQELLRKSK